MYNMQEIEQLELPHPEVEAKNLFLRDDRKQSYYLLTVKGSKQVNLKEFRKANGLRNLSFASEEDLMALLGLHPGAVSPLGLLNDKSRRVNWYLDAAFLPGLIGIHPNDNTASIWLQAEELLNIIRIHGNPVKTAEFPE